MVLKCIRVAHAIHANTVISCSHDMYVYIISLGRSRTRREVLSYGCYVFRSLLHHTELSCASNKYPVATDSVRLMDSDL
ncbi:uncharacterized protein P174DRAFT_186403 [Aspergillus novofumigatus IBT 16806]|uniref:Uncharacterized protein n=1 Tax=Aspergillus novofumigatus (strain IBT 16806) TaxID=1392255 RepID=A0A2I1CA80_ASPN1|nr:uncharacterized protein P174DRAFT_186403 [Aspergillus novofumigatus IBT 16806]PKX94539.1 hypothetical protein P174DRAFT_186403 [Aspergillus novofumigatus IBT 16806]